MSKFTVYSTKTCHWCKASQNLLTQQGHDYSVKFIDSDDAVLNEFKNTFPGLTSVPQILLHEDDGFFRHIGGHDALVQFLIN